VSSYFNRFRRSKSAPSPLQLRQPWGKMDPDGSPSEDTMKMAREVLPGLVSKYGIEASFYGHDHLYERSQRDGAYYIVTGGGGAETYKDSGPKSNPYRQFLYAGLHYCIVTVNGNKGHILAKTPEGKLLDEVNLVAHNNLAAQ
jgi:hypothetical protein